MDALKFILKSRGMSHVIRFMNTPRIRNNDIAQHSYYVTLYTWLICKYLNISKKVASSLVNQALLHDVHEGISVDIPQNVKRKVGKKVYEKIENTAAAEIFGKNVDVCGDVNLIVKYADLMDALIYSTEEYNSGNNFFLIIIKECKLSLVKIAKKIDKIIYRYNRGMMSFTMKLYASIGISKLDGIESDLTSMTHIHKGWS